jgi:hypothetical protein
MELLLNLLWGALAVTAFCAVVRARQDCAGSLSVSIFRTLLAVACVLILLFPVISASDDLHPTQNLFEDSSKRTQPTVAPLTHDVPAFGMLLVLLTMALLFGPMAVQYAVLPATRARALCGVYAAIPSRASPLFLLTR